MSSPMIERQPNRRNSTPPPGASASNTDTREEGERKGVDEPKTPPSSTSPSPSQRSLQSSTGSVSSGKSTWKQRNDKVRGTVVKEGDVGDGYVFFILSASFLCPLSLPFLTMLSSLHAPSFLDTPYTEHGN